MSSNVPPPLALLELIMGSMVTQAIHAAARLDIAEILAEGPLTSGEIASRAGSDPGTTHRLLRALASYSVFAQHEDGRFGLTPMSEALRAGTPMSMRGMALLLGDPVEWEHWGHLVSAVRTGEPVLPKLHGVGGYEFLAANPDFAATFEGGMGDLSKLETEPIIAAYDFSGFGTIVDVFGGNGGLLAAVLQRAPGARGILADPRAGDLDAAGFLREAGVGDRCSVEESGLFEKPPAGGDAYIMKHIVHEWPEEQALEILRGTREVIGDEGRLLLMEFVIPDRPAPHPGWLVDLWLMILMGGRERTRDQYASLLARAGFRLAGVTATASAVSIIEAVPDTRD